jgi:hypothetical protein
LASALQHNNALTKLDLSCKYLFRCPLTNIKATISKIQEQLPGHLFFNTTKLSPTLILLASIFQLSPYQLQGNNIGDSGASALASALQHNNTLTKLDLSGKYFSAVPSPTSRHRE